MVRIAVLVLLAAHGAAFAERSGPESEPFGSMTRGLPAIRYAAMTREECEAELETRGIAFEAETARGVLVPIRLKGSLHGVEFRTNLGEEQRATSLWEIADCRLVLALDDFAAILAEHDIVEVRHYSMYRKPPDRWADDKLGTRHNGALALDAARFIRRDGTKLDVLDDFKGKRGSKTCGPKARKVKDPAAIELREIVCAVVERHLFNVVLTPNFNRAHRNHLHLEVTAGVDWFMVR
jgi:hypothetical protein